MTPLFRTFPLLFALASLPALSLNHDATVPPLAHGPFAVACSNMEVDAVRLAALGGNVSDYWEGRTVNGIQRYATDILARPDAVISYQAPVPDVRRIYLTSAGGTVPFVAIVCHPTPRTNADPDYVMPDGVVVPHMQRAGAAPQIISNLEFAQTLGIQLSPMI